jgi:hypothetical protein
LSALCLSLSRFRQSSSLREGLRVQAAVFGPDLRGTKNCISCPPPVPTDTESNTVTPFGRQKPPTVTDAAMTLVGKAWGAARASADDLSRTVERVSNAPTSASKFELTAEHFLLYGHIIDRIAADVLHARKYGEFKPILWSAVATALATALLPSPPDEKAARQAFDGMLHLAFTFDAEYVKYDFVRDWQTQGLRNTIVWEFSKRITKTVGQPPQQVVLLNPTIVVSVGAAMTIIDAASVLRDVR